MQKNVYSIVLNEDVVEAVDHLAYREGTSRSNMINRILAEYLSLSTPEQQIRDIFSALHAVMEGQSILQPMLQSGDALFSVRSALRYKYNPSVRYAVEIYPHAGEELGELRVSLRTQNPNLLLYLGQFYKLWAKLEDGYLPGPRRVYESGGGRYIRVFRTPENADAEQIGRAIADYIRLFDACLKSFFDHLSDAEAAVVAVRGIYTGGLDMTTAQL